MPVMRQAFRTRTVTGVGRGASPMIGCSVRIRPLPGNRRSNRRLVGPGQSAPDRLNERAISLESQLTSFRFKRRLVRGHRQLMLDEGAQGFGDEVELMLKPLVGPAQPI